MLSGKKWLAKGKWRIIQEKGDQGTDFVFLKKICTLSGDGGKYKKKVSQIRDKMIKVTGKRVFMGIILILILMVVFTYTSTPKRSTAP